MTIATDQNDDDSGLSPHARRMLALREQVFARWEERVRDELDKARALSHPILIDTLPVFYENIAEALSGGHGRRGAVDGTTVAAEHGGERARLTAYDHEALIVEYQLLRRAILDVLYADGLELSAREVLAINESIDAAIQDAVSAFTVVHSALRERFAAALTHDLRGPLGATSTALELILMGDDPARMKTLAVKALDNVHRMGAMIDELLHTMAFHAGEKLDLAMTAFDMLELAREVRLDMAGRGARIEVAGSAVRGWWDRPAMRRALENIVGNAVKYGKAGAPIRIRVDEVHGRLVLSVHNEGEPIPAEDQESIFQMYRRTDTARLTRQQGWGIGLPYVRAVAESHGGSIALDSGGGRGTTFTIDVPTDCRALRGAPTVA